MSNETCTSSSSSFVERIHSTQRNILDSKLFMRPTKICLLDFIGAPKYFISDFGAIWERHHVYPNIVNKLTKGYLPMAVLDQAYPYLWVKLPTTSGLRWFPVNQLLGWAFKPQTDKQAKYFICDDPGLYPHELSEYRWSDTLPPTQTTSRYVAFMESIYR